MSLKDIGDKINESTDTANRWIDDPKNKGAVGVLTVIAAIIILVIISRPSPQNTSEKPAAQSQQTTVKQIDWVKYDKVRADEIWSIIKDSELIEGMTYSRGGEASITYNFKFKINETTVNISTEDYKTLLRTWCVSIAKAYGGNQYIYLYAIMKDTKIASAEYSPFSGNVKVQ